jgi:hypothetical protein
MIGILGFKNQERPGEKFVSKNDIFSGTLCRRTVL